jgi:hypothetical protein
MDGVGESRRASFGLSLLVALGWYATVIAAVLVGRLGIPAAPDRDCSGFLSCPTPQEEIVILAIFGLPVLAGLVFSAVVVTGLLVRWIPSSILAGTLSALGSVAVVAVAIAVMHAVR